MYGYAMRPIAPLTGSLSLVAVIATPALLAEQWYVVMSSR